MSHSVKLGWAAIVGVQFLTGMATQTDPGAQTASRGTGATIIHAAINAANDPNGFIAFFNDGLKRFQDVESVCLAARPETTAAGGEVCPAGRGEDE